MNKITDFLNKSFTNKIFAINILVFLLTSMFPMLVGAFALYPPLDSEFRLWQILTYQFTHGGILHIIFNMLVLYQFGNPVETEMKRYFRYNKHKKLIFPVTYLLFGLIAAATHILILGNNSGPMIGASGSVSGVFALYCLLYPKQKVYFWFLIPVKCLTMLYIFIGLELYAALFAIDNIGHWAHLGGALAGFVFWVTKFKKIQF